MSQIKTQPNMSNYKEQETSFKMMEQNLKMCALKNFVFN